MAEGRYGRLFTEADAIEMVRVCLTMQPYGPQGDAARHIAENAVREWPGGTFPPDEPLFLLRASEPGAVDLLAAIYNSDELNDGAGYVRDSAHYGELVRLQFEFSDWQQAHPDRVKAPD